MILKKAEAGPKQRKLLKTTKPKRRKSLTTDTETTQVAENMTETAQAADNNDQNGASRRKRSQAENKHCNTTGLFYGVTRTRKQGNHEIRIRKANESKDSVRYTKLDAFVQLRLCKSQGTEVIRKSVLPFSLLGDLVVEVEVVETFITFLTFTTSTTFTTKSLI